MSMDTNEQKLVAGGLMAAMGEPTVSPEGRDLRRPLTEVGEQAFAYIRNLRQDRSRAEIDRRRAEGIAAHPAAVRLVQHPQFVRWCTEGNRDTPTTVVDLLCAVEAMLDEQEAPVQEAPEGEEARKTIWVVLKEVNQYDRQYDPEPEGYFMAAFENKPTVDELSGVGLVFDRRPRRATESEHLEYLRHIAGGGGRLAREDIWYTLTEVPLQ